jgi:AcrR family transcriptional regulator
VPPPAATAGRARPLPPAERRADILAAVLPLLIEHGEAVTTRQLAQAACVAEGTIFNVFPDKDALIAAALEAALDQEPFERAIEAVDPTLSFPERLLACTRIVQHRTVDIWRLLSALGPRHQRPHGPLPDSPALIAVFAEHRSDITVTPVEAARILRALTLSLTHPMMTGDPMPAERIVALFLDGVRVTGGTA